MSSPLTTYGMLLRHPVFQVQIHRREERPKDDLCRGRRPGKNWGCPQIYTMWVRRNTVKLQLAVDLTDLVSAMRLLENVIDLVDIVEIGTPLVLKEGARAITEIKKAYPKRDVLADLKIMDAGDIEARIGFDAGADIVTALGVANDATICLALDQARACGKEVMVDLIAVANIEERACAIDAMGAHYVCVHTAFDVQSQGANPLRELECVQPVLKRSRMAVALGTSPMSLPQSSSGRLEVIMVERFS